MTPDPQTAAPWRPGDAAKAIGLVLGGFFLVVLVAYGVTGSVESDEGRSVAPWMIGLSQGLMLLAVWLFGIRKYGVPWRTAGLRRPAAGSNLGLPAAALVASLAFTTVYALTVSSLGLDVLVPKPLPADALGHGATRAINVLLILLLGPFAEELFFRGFVFTALIAPFGAVRAAVISSAVFALAHVSLGTMVPIFVTGLLMAWLYVRGRSVWLPAQAHAAQNLIALVVIA